MVPPGINFLGIFLVVPPTCKIGVAYGVSEVVVESFVPVSVYTGDNI